MVIKSLQPKQPSCKTRTLAHTNQSLCTDLHNRAILIWQLCIQFDVPMSIWEKVSLRTKQFDFHQFAMICTQPQDINFRDDFACCLLQFDVGASSFRKIVIYMFFLHKKGVQGKVSVLRHMLCYFFSGLICNMEDTNFLIYVKICTVLWCSVNIVEHCSHLHCE